MNRNGTGKLQVKLLFAYISWNKLYWYTFKAPSEEVIEMGSEKMKVKYIKEDVWKSFFCKPTSGHLATSLGINFFTDDERLRMVNSRSSIKCLKSTSEIVFYLLMVEILQLVHEISIFPEVFYERGVMKNFSKSTDKHKNQSSGGVLSNKVLKNFSKFAEKIFAGISFLIKLQAGNLKLSEADTGNVLQKKMFLKISQIPRENTCAAVYF